MEGEMEVVLEGEKDFRCSEFDVDYEFDAPRYFELGREELQHEAQQAEFWFETAGNYAPSPLLVKISFGKKGKQENIDANFNIRDVHSLDAQMCVYACPDSSLCGSLAGRAYDTCPLKDLPNDNQHAALDGTVSSNPCFMKPTTSQLATQNLVPRSAGWSVFQRPVTAQSRSSEDPIHGLLHADKRQKLAEGHACKVVGHNATK
ncbi:uncharacterized protein LOC110030561 [Phalaenopsis equestris]|uniref:uncharacterized protein LOC110030561 n=1 Tax=Phalaenopsis equestris TaxID=78828 RepID=UPI0009E652E6|nr:uncharacterized protein LOC110030561 [Phalaenopsis equestris]